MLLCNVTQIIMLQFHIPFYLDELLFYKEKVPNVKYLLVPIVDNGIMLAF